MAQKWTDEQREKFKVTMRKIYAEKRRRKAEAAKKSKYRAEKKLHYKGNGLEQRKTDPANLPVIEVSSGATDMQEFAAFMAEAYKVYKGL